MPTLLLLAIGVGAVVLLAQANTASAAQAQASSSWPPSAADQQDLYNQILSMAQATGQPITSADQAELQQLLAGGPQTYLAQGGYANVAAYKQWAMSHVYEGLMGSLQMQQGGGAQPGFFPPAGYTGTASVQGRAHRGPFG